MNNKELDQLRHEMMNTVKSKTDYISPDVSNNSNQRKGTKKVISMKNVNKIEEDHIIKGLNSKTAANNTLINTYKATHEKSKGYGSTKNININDIPTVNITSKSRVVDTQILDELDQIMDEEVNNYRKVNYERITPNLIMKFSAGFDRIVEYCDRVYQDTDTTFTKKTRNSVLKYIKNAYESFIKRVVGVADFSEIEGVLKKCLELSSPKFSPKSSDRNKDNKNSTKRTVKSYSLLIDEFKELTSENQLLRQDLKEIKSKMEQEFNDYSDKKTSQLKKLKAIIRQMKYKLDDVSKAEVSMSKYNKLKDNLKQALIENQELTNVTYKLKDQAEDLNKKKNRLNFLIFL